MRVRGYRSEIKRKVLSFNERGQIASGGGWQGGRSVVAVLLLGALLVMLFPGESDAVDSEARAAAEVVMRLSGFEETVKLQFERMRELMSAQVEQMDVPAGEESLMEELSERMLSIMEEELAWEKRKDDYVRIYAETFTVAELRGLSQFYQTALGRALLEKMPQVTQKSMELGQESAARMTTRFDALMDEYQARFWEKTKE